MHEYDRYVDVVIPIHGGWDLVQRCITSIENQTVRCEIIVVDDASPDESAAWIAHEFPAVRVISTGRNVGFARACNIGISASSASFVLLVNSDVVADPKLIAEVCAEFESDERIGSVTVELRDPEGRVDAAGVTVDPTLAGFVRYHGATSSDPRSPVLSTVYGAVAGYRRKALNEVGLFDERLFMYGEELELGLRLLHAGWRTGLALNGRAMHVGGGTVGAGSARQRYLAGYARGYTVRVYDVLKSRYAARTMIVEALTSLARIFLSRDLAAARGRVDGWRAGKGVVKRPRPIVGIDVGIGMLESVKMRGRGYWMRNGHKWINKWC